MDTAYLSALAALTGTAVGGLTSFFSTWLAQNAQFKAQLFLHDKGHRQELYRDFVDEASQLYIDALTNDQPNLSKTITLYALVSQMRFISSPKVIEEAEKVVRVILETYPNPTRHLVSCAIWRAIIFSRRTTRSSITRLPPFAALLGRIRKSAAMGRATVRAPYRAPYRATH